MLLYISGSYPNNQEGIASGAKVLLDAMTEIVGVRDIILLTTDIPIISDTIKENSKVEYRQLKNWRVTSKNIKTIYNILGEYPITAIHMEYPGDLYGKTFLATWLPFLVKRYNRKNKRNITFNVRLHEFTRARFLRKLAIIPILWFANTIYVPALHDRKVTSIFGGNKVKATIIGTNIKVVEDEVISGKEIVISYFGSVYPGKGIERMLQIWKQLRERNKECSFSFKIIGDVGIGDDNHFADYHKQVWKWIEQYGLKDNIVVTGYISDEEVSKELSRTSIATLPYEDGLTLRRGSFLAYLTHGIPIVTTEGDEEAHDLFDNHKGIVMASSDEEMILAVESFVSMKDEEKVEVRQDNFGLAKKFDWTKIARDFLIDYKMI
ncbi:MAG: glycosyltransferase [Lachnospiraceae bacterium]|nr:glycosyltransferase [Lachnospiraceae bacterium]